MASAAFLAAVMTSAGTARGPDKEAVARPDLSTATMSVQHFPRTRVAVVTMRGTGAGNAMGARVWSELPELMTVLEAADEIGAVVLRGDGDCFTVGLDLLWYIPKYRRLARLGEGSPRFRRELLAEATRMQNAISRIQHSPLGVVAAVHGACIGAGLDLATACDIRLASTSAFFSVREARIGIVADLGVLQRLPRLIGAGPARELALTARDLPAAEAAVIGLVSGLFATPAELFDQARATAARIAGNLPHVTAGIKELMNSNDEFPLSAGLRHAAVWNAAFLPSPELPGLMAGALRGDDLPDEQAATR
jgi:enoyl-CoA hydratase